VGFGSVVDERVLVRALGGAGYIERSLSNSKCVVSRPITMKSDGNLSGCRLLVVRVLVP
jgi:hypothetical protein